MRLMELTIPHPAFDVAGEALGTKAKLARPEPHRERHLGAIQPVFRDAKALGGLVNGQEAVAIG
jgi:hypothetical protein